MLQIDFFLLMRSEPTRFMDETKSNRKTSISLISENFELTSTIQEKNLNSEFEHTQ